MILSCNLKNKKEKNMDNKKLTTEDISEFVEAFNTLFDLLKDIDPTYDDDDWCDCDDCDCDDCDCGYCDDYDCDRRNMRDDDGEDEDDDTVYRLTEKTIMMLVLKGFGIDVSLEKADEIYKALVNDLDKAGYIEYVPDDEDN